MNSQTEITTLNNKLGIFEYVNDGFLRVVGTAADPWFNAKDIATILGYKNTTQAIRKNVDEEDRNQLENLGGVKASKNNQPKSTFINKRGVIALLTKTRQIVPDDFITFLTETFGIIITKHYRYVCKEAETIGYITRSLKGVDYKLQHKIGKYRVDMYFPRYRIIVECDEEGHIDRDEEYEKTRETYLKSKIQGCKLVRYNPDDKKFDIYKVINTIFTYMLDCHLSRDDDWYCFEETDYDEEDDEDDEE